MSTNVCIDHLFLISLLLLYNIEKPWLFNILIACCPEVTKQNLVGIHFMISITKRTPKLLTTVFPSPKIKSQAIEGTLYVDREEGLLNGNT